MYLEFIVYVFIICGFLGGILRGVKKELFTLISVISAFACVLFAYKPLIEALRQAYDLKQIYEIGVVNTLLGGIGITLGGFEYLVVGGLMFLIVFAILNTTFKALIFNAKRAASGKAKGGNRFLGGLVGLVSGLFLAMFFMIFFRACITDYNLEADATLTRFIANNIPFLSDKIRELFDCVCRK